MAPNHFGSLPPKKNRFRFHNETQAQCLNMFAFIAVGRRENNFVRTRNGVFGDFVCNVPRTILRQARKLSVM